MDSKDRLKTGFAALPEELHLEIYKWSANRMVLKTVPGIKHVRWVATTYNSGITGVSREIQQAAGDTLYALDREKKARLFVHWKGIKQLPRLLQLLAHTYTWGKRWLEANPPNATDGQQDWVRVKKSTSHDLNALLYEYLNPSHYKKIFSELGDPSRSPTLSALVRDWFSDIATKCNTAAPIPMDTTERRLLIEFLEMTMDKLRNPNTRGDLEISITVPKADTNYADPDDQTRRLYLDDVVEYMYQLFETFRTHFRIKFRFLAVLNTPADEFKWILVGGYYAEFVEPSYNLVQTEGTGGFEVKLGSIARVDHEALDMA
ncbi:hypothetical protein J4E90_002721 [Alternaria incomplexa]|uniref:uncharacterized protein n=1 Tax=Alternaria incomplexa TaxID=1187928 RepID=UPI00221E9408|nr:uncharacterized protein J4E90_002721 [Alternaria incomplexa]XP_051298080.1 uncharacterized protein J4E86_010388 [Alternaria arbusti]KAI4918337.1 hypothetical protein J4E90_002721 [Alternaria incomplexa]KAI4941877.1 hypothetical protein J4E86_010388 [Alternaria arbusti]